MCLGVPMRVLESHPFLSKCEGRGEIRSIQMALVGAQTPGTWVMAFLGQARQVLTEDEAMEINLALDALEAAFAGETDFERFFPDIPSRSSGAANGLTDGENP